MQMVFSHFQGSFFCGMYGVDTVAPRTVPYLWGICKIVFSQYTTDRMWKVDSGRGVCFDL